jgi:hypothetical protein
VTVGGRAGRDAHCPGRGVRTVRSRSPSRRAPRSRWVLRSGLRSRQRTWRNPQVRSTFGEERDGPCVGLGRGVAGTRRGESWPEKAYRCGSVGDAGSTHGDWFSSPFRIQKSEQARGNVSIRSLAEATRSRTGAASLLPSALSGSPGRVRHEYPRGAKALGSSRATGIALPQRGSGVAADADTLAIGNDAAATESGRALPQLVPSRRPLSAPRDDAVTRKGERGPTERTRLLSVRQQVCREPSSDDRYVGDVAEAIGSAPGPPRTPGSTTRLAWEDEAEFGG